MAGAALQIAVLENQRVKINLANCRSIFEQVGDHPVAIVSVNGSMRTGKSYILEHFLRYLIHGAETDCWFHQTLKSEFHWLTSADRQTTGILMWSKPFFVQKEDRKIGVLLMDTQGCFDRETTRAETNFIFSMSCLLSSVLVYNVSHQLANDVLENIQLFLAFSRLALPDNDGLPQATSKLVFLIRDWQFPNDYLYGVHSDAECPPGKNFKKEKVDVRANMAPEVKTVHRDILESFESVECCLLPHPGKSLATKGDAEDLDPEFVTAVENFVPRLLDSRTMVVKVIGGQEVTGKEMLGMLEKWAEHFAKVEIPYAKSAVDCAVEVQNAQAYLIAHKYYRNEMNAVSRDANVSEQQFEEKHYAAKAESIRIFRDHKRMKDKGIEDRFTESLKHDIQVAYHLFRELHRSRWQKRYAERELQNERSILAAMHQQEVELLWRLLLQMAEENCPNPPNDCQIL